MRKLSRPGWPARAHFAVLALAMSVAAPATSAGRPPDLLGMAHVNNRIEHVAFRIDPRQRHVSEIRVRSGSLAVHLLVVEITFLDGGHARFMLDETLPPGRPSRPLPVDRLRPIAEVAVTKRPGLRPGETALQLLGSVQPAPARALPRGR